MNVTKENLNNEKERIVAEILINENKDENDKENIKLKEKIIKDFLDKRKKSVIEETKREQKLPQKKPKQIYDYIIENNMKKR